jgi:urease accessory protein
MLMITNVLGNLKKDSQLFEKYDEYLKRDCVENVLIHRSESEKIRMRRMTDKDTDIGLNLPSRTHLRDGDIVFLDDSKMIVIRISPELVAILRFKNPTLDKNNLSDIVNMSVKIGHTIGNLHRPLKIEENRVVFPIQSPDEIELFRRLLSNVENHITLNTEKMVFEPDQGFDIHAH